MLRLPPGRIIYTVYTTWHALVIKQAFSIPYFHGYEVTQVKSSISSA